MTIPKVECSLITFWVPIFAASSNGIVSSNQGVFTILIFWSSKYPIAGSITKPTQSIKRTFTNKDSSIFKVIACEGTNLGSIVIIVLPLPDCGNSSKALFLSSSSTILGITATSINFFINVDLPTRTGPTTPK